MVRQEVGERHGFLEPLACERPPSLQMRQRRFTQHFDAELGSRRLRQCPLKQVGRGSRRPVLERFARGETIDERGAGPTPNLH